MFFPGLDKITDTISNVKDAVAPVTQPVGDAFNGAVERARSKASDVVDIAGGIPSVVGAALDGDGARPLSAEEEAIAREYFGDSIDYGQVTINESSAQVEINELHPENSSGRPFVAGNTIHFDHELDLNHPDDRGTFLHEMTHVWQFQSTRGLDTTREGIALSTQDGAYKLDTITLDPTNSKTFDDFTIEQQAEIVRGDFLLAEHERLNNHLRYDPSLSFQERQEIQEKIDFIEDEDRFKELTAAGFSAGNLNPYIERIQNTKPREGIVAESEEALSEIVREVTDENIELTDIIFGPIGGRLVDTGLEVGEGGLEIGREAGKAVLEETGEAIIAGAQKADETFSDIKDLVTGRRFPFG